MNLLKKKAQLGVLDNAEPDISITFPREGFSTDISGMPKLTFGTIWRYMIDGVECKKQISTAKPLVKGYNFYKSGHVLFISHLSENGKHYMKSQVMPSMKKKAVYLCYLVLTSVGNVLRAHCGCPAGVDGRCNHVASTMFALEEYIKVRDKQCTESCTSKPCKWNVPRKRTGSVTPIAQMKFCKHDYAKTKQKRRSAVPPGHDVRALHQRSWPDSRVKNMLSLVQEYQEMSGNVVGWSHILPQNPEVGNENVNEDDVCDENVISDELLSPLKEQPICLSVLRQRCEQVKRKLQLSEREISEAENSTRGQSDNASWYALRKYRITASKCHRVAALRETTSPTKAIQDVLKLNTPYQSESMKAGLEMEDKIVKEYTELMQQKGHAGITVTKCGFFVSKEHGFLGASPDGLVSDPSSVDSRGLIEVKFIQVTEHESLSKSVLKKRICVKKDDALELNTKHKYYYQVHQQMYVTERKWADFVVQGTQSSELFCQRVEFSKVFWEATFSKLTLFFDRWIAPEVAYPRIKHGLPKLDIRSVV